MSSYVMSSDTEKKKEIRRQWGVCAENIAV
jgi:hypothetical protein